VWARKWFKKKRKCFVNDTCLFYQQLMWRYHESICMYAKHYYLISSWMTTFISLCTSFVELKCDFYVVREKRRKNNNNRRNDGWWKYSYICLFHQHVDRLPKKNCVQLKLSRQRQLNFTTTQCDFLRHETTLR
jgi:hypothetical protein